MTIVFISLYSSGCLSGGNKNNNFEIESGSIKETRVFGATFMTMNNPFFVEVNEGLKSVIESNGDKLITLDPQLSQQKQIVEIEELISKKVDAIFLNPVDWKEIKPALDAANKKGIPIIVVDAPVFDDMLVECTVASDNWNAGVLVAKHMMARKEAMNIVILDFPINKPCIERISGFLETINNNSQYKVIARYGTNGTLEDAMPIMENVLENNDDIDVVIGANDPIAIGALAALKAADKLDHVMIYGVDGSPDAKKLIKDGYMVGSAAQSPRHIGEKAADSAYKMLAGEKLEKDIKVPVSLVTQDNIDEYGTEDWQ